MFVGTVFVFSQVLRNYVPSRLHRPLRELQRVWQVARGRVQQVLERKRGHRRYKGFVLVLQEEENELEWMDELEWQPV